MDIGQFNGDTSKIEAYLYKLNRDLEYMFSHLTPEDNFNEKERLIYVADQERQSSLEIALDHISLEMVSKDNIVAAINLSDEGVKIQGDKIGLEGVVTVNSRFKIGLDGSMEANNGIFQGDISASNITGSTLTGGTINAGGTSDGKLIVYNSSGTEIGRWDKDGIKVKSGTIEGTGITVGGSGNVGTITVKNSGGTPIGTWDNTGIDVKAGKLAGTTISGSTISGSTINVGGTGTAGSIVVKDGTGNPIGSWTTAGIDIDKGTISGTGITLGGSGSAGTITVYGTTGTTPIGTWNASGLHVYKGDIKGPTIEIGGLDNANGTLTVKNASGVTIGTWDNSGIHVYNGGLSVTGGGSITGSTITGGEINGTTISVGQFYSNSTYTKVGGFYASTNYGRDIFCTENEETGMSADPMTLGRAFFWAGYDSDSDSYQFLVNNGGQVWANDFGIWGETWTLQDVINEVSDFGGIGNRVTQLRIDMDQAQDDIQEIKDYLGL